MKHYISVAEATKQLGVHRETIYRWIREGKIEYIRIGKKYHIDPESLEQPANPNR